MISREASNRTDGTLYLDETSDVADLEQYAEDNKLTAGQAAVVIETGEVYLLKSTGEWKKQ